MTPAIIILIMIISVAFAAGAAFGVAICLMTDEVRR